MADVAGSFMLEQLRTFSRSVRNEWSSVLAEHNSTRGENRERSLKQGLLRPFLPKRYGLGDGLVFDKEGRQSNQIDVVVYDDLFSVVFPKQKFFPAESVYGTIELKSNLNTGELQRGVANIRSVKSLVRDDSDQLDITPLFHLAVGKGLEYGREKKNHFMGLIVGKDGMSGTRSKRVLEEMSYGEGDLTLPDAVFNVTRGEILFRMRGNTIIGPGGAYDKWYVFEVGDDVLPILSVYMASALRNIQLREGETSLLLARTIGEHLDGGIG